MQPTSRAASKIGGLKRGSTALRIASHPLGARELDDRGAVGGVERRRGVALVSGRDRAGALDRHVREDDPLEEAPPRRDRGHRRADAAGTDDEDPHARDARRRRRPA